MIKTINIQNFKCFLNETIQLSNLNLLTGLNGMGKSSVIQSLLLLRQNYENGLLTFKKQLGLNGEYVQVGTSADLLYRYFDKKEISITLENTDGSKYDWSWDASGNFDILPELHSGQNEYSAEYSLFNENFHYLNAERIGPRPYYETSTTKVIHQNQLGIRGEFAANYFVHNRDLKVSEALKFDEETGLTLYEQVNAWFSVIRPGTKVVIKEQPDSGTVSLHFEFVLGKDNPGSYRANNVGFGLTYIFPLILAVLSSKPNTLLLLENPEAHIHPKGQAELGIFLARAAASGIQIVVETHSDHILNGIRYATKQGYLTPENSKLMFFTGEVRNERFEHKIKYIQITPNGKLTERPDDFFDSWDKLLVKLI